MSLRVGFDIDGVLADFRNAFRAVATDVARDRADVSDPEQVAGVSLSEADIKRVWKEVSATHNWWTTLRPYEATQITRLYDLARRWRWDVFFLTKRPSTDGDTVQLQTQSWLEQYGYYLPAVLTVLGSRGELANALHLDLVIDDQQLNCVEVVSASSAKALLMLRDASLHQLRDHALSRGIGVVSSVQEALNVLEGLQEVLPQRRGRMLRLIDWFPIAKSEGPSLPMNPRIERPLPKR